MEYLKIGIVVKAHGVKGVVRVYPLTDDIRRFSRLKKVYLERSGEYRQMNVSAVSLKDNMVHIKLHGVEDRDAAEALKQQYLFVKREDAVELPKDSYFISDLIGCEVFDEKGSCYGRITDVLQTGANDVYVVQGEKELLMPAIKKLITRVDVEKKQIMIRSDAVPEVVPDAD